MPPKPNVSFAQQYSIVATPLTPLLSPLSPKGTARKPLRQHTCCCCCCCSIGIGIGVAGKMKITKKRLLPVLVCILSIASIIRLIKIANFTSSPALLPPLLSHLHPPGTRGASSHDDDPTLTDKEVRFLADIVSNRAPCNLLVFGIERQYLTLFASINAGGLTVFLEDEPEKLKSSFIKTLIISNSSSVALVYKVEYSTLAREAYKLLKHARRDKSNCSPWSSLKKCKLGLKKLPAEIYKTKWDVVVVDGPCGERPDCPGRMASIYTASVLARNTTSVANVVVHDIHRTIDKWFSWEFLCQSNLVSSKGKFWNFRIPAAAAPQYNNNASTTFCPRMKH